jgi:hypothetical protein
VVSYDLARVTIAEIIEQIRHACLFMWLRAPAHDGVATPPADISLAP